MDIAQGEARFHHFGQFFVGGDFDVFAVDPVEFFKSIRLGDGETSFKSNHSMNCSIVKNSSSPCAQPKRAR